MIQIIMGVGENVMNQMKHAKGIESGTKKEAETVKCVVEKAHTSLDSWMLFITNYRVIVTRFDAWGTAFGGPVGVVLDKRRRSELTWKDPNKILATQKNSYALDFQELSSVDCKKSITGSKITFNLKDGSKKKFGMGKTDYLRAVEAMTPHLESIMNIK